MNDIYSTHLLAHAKHPFGAGKIPRGSEDAEAFHSGCGDEIRVKCTWQPNGVLESLVFEIHGCAVSTAVASMTAQRVCGKTADAIQAMSTDFLARLGHDGFDASWGDFQALNGLEKFPARLHCARLIWCALEQVLQKRKRDNEEKP